KKIGLKGQCQQLWKKVEDERGVFKKVEKCCKIARNELHVTIGAGLGAVSVGALRAGAGAGLGAAAGAVAGGAAGIILGPCAIATAAAGAAAGAAVGAAAGVTIGGIRGAIVTLYRRRCK
ncbi:unnamed protein product, partial [Didymodactylos carnosus]